MNIIDDLGSQSDGYNEKGRERAIDREKKKKFMSGKRRESVGKSGVSDGFSEDRRWSETMAYKDLEASRLLLPNQ